MRSAGGSEGAAPLGAAPNADACCQAGVADVAAKLARERRDKVRRVFWITLALNTVVAVSKAAYSYVSGSLTLGADSLHAVLDASSNVLALFSLGWAAAPADARHPYGRQKIEILAALGIGVLIVAGLLEFTQAAIGALMAGRHAPRVGWPGFVVVLASPWPSACSSAGTSTTRGTSWGASCCTPTPTTPPRTSTPRGRCWRRSWPSGQGSPGRTRVATLVLVVLIGRAAWNVFRDNIPVLIDAARLDPAGVVELARSVEGVSDVHRVRSRGMRRAVELDLHLEVAPEMSVVDAHNLAQQIEREVKVKFPEVSDVIIHVEPKTH